LTPRDTSAKACRRTQRLGSKTDQIKGYANEAAGKVKQGVGKLSATRGCVQRRYAGDKGLCSEGRWQSQGRNQGRGDKFADKAHKTLITSD
jgi:uncharacterized protein YjbJ (UPF0337 family)